MSVYYISRITYMTNKFLNIMIIILSVFIVTYFAMRIVYWGLEIDKQDKEFEESNPTAVISYSIDSRS